MKAFEKGSFYMKFIHTLTHRFSLFTHTKCGDKNCSDLHFPSLSTVLQARYYYYLYIYKISFQANHPQITVLHKKSTYMSARATA